MYEQQEEYLVVVKYDVKLFLDLVHLKFGLQRVDEELCKVKRKCIERGLLKKSPAKLLADYYEKQKAEEYYLISV